MLDVQLAVEVEGSAACAALAQRATRHPNAPLVCPLWQGDGCEGLSALYAVVNGIRLALAHRTQLTAPEVHRLLLAGAWFLDGRSTVRQSLFCGLRLQTWRGLVDAMVEAARQRLGARIAAERLYPEWPPSRQASFDALERAVRQLRVPLMLCRGGHYTVVSGVTPSSVILLDSRGACWMARRVCGVPSEGDTLRHCIYPASFMALTI